MIRPGLVFVGCVLCLSTLGCNSERASAPSPSAPSGPTRSAAPRPLLPETPVSPSAVTESEATRSTTSEIFAGTGQFVAAATALPEPIIESAPGSYTLNFVNADVRDAARTVFRDLLHLNFSIAGNAQGTITLQTTRPLLRDEVLPTFEQALHLSGLAVVHVNDVYTIVAAADAPQSDGMLVQASEAARVPGYGLEVVKLKYVSASDLQRLLAPMIPKGMIIAVDRVRNLLFIGGDGNERVAVLNDVALFDVDWLKGMSFALYRPHLTDAKTLASELAQIVDGPESPLIGLVRLVPIERLNAILAISPQATYLSELQQWVDRLDQDSSGGEERIFVYYVQNGRARDLAATLEKIVGQESSTPGSPSVLSPPEGLTSSPTQSAPPALGPPATAAATPTGGAPSSAPAPAAPVPPMTQASPEDIALTGVENVKITADEMNNALLIRGTAHQYEIIAATLKKLDIPPLQVLLEAAIAEVTLTDELQFGVQYFFQRGHHQIILDNTSATPIATSLPGFAYSFSSGASIQAILSALQSETSVNVVSAPKVLVLNNQTATLEVGDQVPIATSSAVSVSSPGAPVVNTIEFKDTGVILKIIPRVNESGLVMMDVSQEVSDVVPTTTSTLNSPTIEERKVSSTVAVEDGETIALGGMIQDSKNKNHNGIPLLQDIPVLGSIFRSADDTRKRTELLVLITPHLVQGTQRARDITDELSHELPAARSSFDHLSQ